MKVKKQKGFLSLLSLIHLVGMAAGATFINEVMKDEKSLGLLFGSALLFGFVCGSGVTLYRKFLK